MRRIQRLELGRLWKKPLFWLAVLYVLTGAAYVLVTPMLEKHDEEGHYGYIRYLREHRRLPPLHSSEQWLAESKQPPLYYVVATALTAWLPDVADDGRLLVLNPYMDFSVPGYRNDNRNQYLHPPYLTPVVLGARLLSLAFGLGTLLAAHWLATLLFPQSTLIPLAVAAVVGFQPKFLYVATAVNNDAAVVFLSTLVVAILVYRLQKGPLEHFSVLLGVLLGLASLTKVSGLVLLPLAGLALLFIHRGPRSAFFRDGVVILVVAVLCGGWWYGRNALLYDDAFTLGAHTSDAAAFRPLWERLGHDLAGIEHNFWANLARTFVSEIWLSRFLIWWGRISLGLFVVGLVWHWSEVRANLPTWIVLLSWPLTYFFLLVVYWNQKYRWPFARLVFPAIVPLFVCLVWGWQRMLPRRWRRPGTALGAGSLVVASVLIPFVSLYPLYRPWRERSAEQIEHPLDVVYVNAGSGERIARLVGYNVPEPYTSPGTYFLIELCWESLGQTTVPYAVFVQLLDLSQLETFDSPGIWGRRETYPGLGNLPTDRWPSQKRFCDTVMTWVYPQTPAPLGAAIEVGFVNPETGSRLQPENLQGETLPLAVVGGVSVLPPGAFPALEEPALYVLDDAIALKRVQLARESEITLTLTWQALRAVPYDATMFVHLKGADGNNLTQIDRQPLAGRFPTSFWLPGQVITDVVALGRPVDTDEALTLGVGLYTWPSLQRLPVKDAAGTPQSDNTITLDIPPPPTKITVP